MAKAPAGWETENCNVTDFHLKEGAASPALTIGAMMRGEVRNPGANSYGSFAGGASPQAEASPAAASASQSKVKHSALTSGSPPRATRA